MPGPDRTSLNRAPLRFPCGGAVRTRWCRALLCLLFFGLAAACGPVVDDLKDVSARSALVISRTSKAVLNAMPEEQYVEPLVFRVKDKGGFDAVGQRLRLVRVDVSRRVDPGTDPDALGLLPDLQKAVLKGWDRLPAPEESVANPEPTPAERKHALFGQLSAESALSDERGQILVRAIAPAVYGSTVAVLAVLDGVEPGESPVSDVIFLRTPENPDEHVALSLSTEPAADALEAGVPFTLVVSLVDGQNRVIDNAQAPLPVNVAFQTDALPTWTGTRSVLPQGERECLFQAGVCRLQFQDEAPLVVHNAMATTRLTVWVKDRQDVPAAVIGIKPMRGAPAALVLADTTGGPASGSQPLSTGSAFELSADEARTVAAAWVDRSGNFTGDANVDWSGSENLTARLSNRGGPQTTILPGSTQGADAAWISASQGTQSIRAEVRLVPGAAVGLTVDLLERAGGTDAGSFSTGTTVGAEPTTQVSAGACVVPRVRVVDRAGNVLTGLTAKATLHLGLRDFSTLSRVAGVDEWQRFAGGFYVWDEQESSLRPAQLKATQLYSGEGFTGFARSKSGFSAVSTGQLEVNVLGGEVSVPLLVCLSDVTGVRPRLLVTLTEWAPVSRSTAAEPLEGYGPLTGQTPRIEVLAGAPARIAFSDAQGREYCRAAVYQNYPLASQTDAPYLRFAEDALRQTCSGLSAEDGPLVLYARVQDGGGNTLRRGSGSWVVREKPEGTSVGAQSSDALEFSTAVPGLYTVEFTDAATGLTAVLEVPFLEGKPYSFVVVANNGRPITADQPFGLSFYLVDATGAEAREDPLQTSRQVGIVYQTPPGPSPKGTQPVMPVSFTSAFVGTSGWHTPQSFLFPSVGSSRLFVVVSDLEVGLVELNVEVAPGALNRLDIADGILPSSAIVGTQEIRSVDTRTWYAVGRDRELNFIGPVAATFTGTGSSEWNGALLTANLLPGQVIFKPVVSGSGRIQARPVDLRHQSIVASTGDLTVIDAEMDHFEIDIVGSAANVEDPLIAGNEYTIRVRAVDVNGVQVGSFSGVKEMVLEDIYKERNEEGRSLVTPIGYMAEEQIVSEEDKRVLVTFTNGVSEDLTINAQNASDQISLLVAHDTGDLVGGEPVTFEGVRNMVSVPGAFHHFAVSLPDGDEFLPAVDRSATFRLRLIRRDEAGNTVTDGNGSQNVSLSLFDHSKTDPKDPNHIPPCTVEREGLQWPGFPTPVTVQFSQGSALLEGISIDRAGVWGIKIVTQEAHQLVCAAVQTVRSLDELPLSAVDHFVLVSGYDAQCRNHVFGGNCASFSGDPVVLSEDDGHFVVQAHPAHLFLMIPMNPYGEPVTKVAKAIAGQYGQHCTVKRAQDIPQCAPTTSLVIEGFTPASNVGLPGPEFSRQNCDPSNLGGTFYSGTECNLIERAPYFDSFGYSSSSNMDLGALESAIQIFLNFSTVQTLAAEQLKVRLRAQNGNALAEATFKKSIEVRPADLYAYSFELDGAYHEHNGQGELRVPAAKEAPFSLTIRAFDHFANPVPGGSGFGLGVVKASGSDPLVPGVLRDASGESVTTLPAISENGVVLQDLHYGVAQRISFTLTGLSTGSSYSSAAARVLSPVIDFYATPQTVVEYDVTLSGVELDLAAAQASVFAGEPFTARIEALDVAGNTIQGLDTELSTLDFTWQGPSEKFPTKADFYVGSGQQGPARRYTFVEGAATFPMIFYKAETLKQSSILRVFDDQPVSRSGSIPYNLRVNPNAVVALDHEGPGGAEAGKSAKSTVFVLDLYGNKTSLQNRGTLEGCGSAVVSDPGGNASPGGDFGVALTPVLPPPVEMAEGEDGPEYLVNVTWYKKGINTFEFAACGLTSTFHVDVKPSEPLETLMRAVGARPSTPTDSGVYALDGTSEVVCPDSQNGGADCPTIHLFQWDPYGNEIPTEEEECSFVWHPNLASPPSEMPSLVILGTAVNLDSQTYVDGYLVCGPRQVHVYGGVKSMTAWAETRSDSRGFRDSNSYSGATTATAFGDLRAAADAFRITKIALTYSKGGVELAKPDAGYAQMRFTSNMPVGDGVMGNKYPVYPFTHACNFNSNGECTKDAQGESIALDFERVRDSGGWVTLRLLGQEKTWTFGEIYPSYPYGLRSPELEPSSVAVMANVPLPVTVSLVDKFGNATSASSSRISSCAVSATPYVVNSTSTMDASSYDASNSTGGSGVSFVAPQLSLVDGAGLGQFSGNLTIFTRDTTPIYRVCNVTMMEGAAQSPTGFGSLVVSPAEPVQLRRSSLSMRTDAPATGYQGRTASSTVFSFDAYGNRTNTAPDTCVITTAAAERQAIQSLTTSLSPPGRTFTLSTTNATGLFAGDSVTCTLGGLTQMVAVSGSHPAYRGFLTWELSPYFCPNTNDQNYLKFALLRVRNQALPEADDLALNEAPITLTTAHLSTTTNSQYQGAWYSNAGVGLSLGGNMHPSLAGTLLEPGDEKIIRVRQAGSQYNYHPAFDLIARPIDGLTGFENVSQSIPTSNSSSWMRCDNASRLTHSLTTGMSTWSCSKSGTSGQATIGVTTLSNANQTIYAPAVWPSEGHAASSSCPNGSTLANGASCDTVITSSRFGQQVALYFPTQGQVGNTGYAHSAIILSESPNCSADLKLTFAAVSGQNCVADGSGEPATLVRVTLRNPNSTYRAAFGPSAAIDWDATAGAIPGATLITAHTGGSDPEPSSGNPICADGMVLATAGSAGDRCDVYLRFDDTITDSSLVTDGLLAIDLSGNPPSPVAGESGYFESFAIAPADLRTSVNTSRVLYQCAP